MLENIEDLSTLRLEGQEDIEIKLNDESYILAQAKSVENSSTDFRNVRSNLKKSLESLSEAANRVGKANRLIVITNSPNPINEDESRSLFYGHAHRSYSSLPQSTQKIIDEYLSHLDNALHPTSLSIQVLPFETDDDKERYKEVMNVISDFLSRFDFPIDGLRPKLHEIWSYSVFKNGTRQNEELRLTKKDIIWPIIVCVTDKKHIGREESVLATIDDGEYDVLIRKYEDIINSCTERFDFVTSVISDFHTDGYSGREAIPSFINERWKDYLDEFEICTIDIDLKAKLIKVILYIILKKRFDINDIKQKVKL